MTQGIRVTLGVLALCLIILLIVVSKQMVNSRILRHEVGTVRHTLTTSQHQLEAAQALVQRLQQQVEHTRAQIAHTEAQRQQAQDQVVHTEAQLQQVQDRGDDAPAGARPGAPIQPDTATTRPAADAGARCCVDTARPVAGHRPRA